jgi:hypothetical protein
MAGFVPQATNADVNRTIAGSRIDSGSNQAPSADPVEAALATALEGATRAGEWATVAQLARELEARRKAKERVVDLTSERARRGR